MAAWYIATETTSELGYKDEIVQEVKVEVADQIDTMSGLNQTLKGHGRTENLFEDADLQMAGYAAALRVLHHFEVELPHQIDQFGHFVGPFTLTSLAFNPLSGQPAVSYYDRNNGTIRCAIGTVYEQGMLTALFSFIRDLLRRIRRYGGFRRTGTSSFHPCCSRAATW